MTTYISDIAHYNEVLSRVASVKHSLIIGTADIKDLYVKVGSDSQPFLAVLDMLIRRGVEVRLLHAKEPGPNFQNDFDKGVERDSGYMYGPMMPRSLYFGLKISL